MKEFKREKWICGLVLSVLIHLTHGGIAVQETKTTCLTEESDLVITCPTDHRVSFKSVKFFKSREQGCPKTSDQTILGGKDMCMVHNALDLTLSLRCLNLNQPCTLNLTDLMEGADDICEYTFEGEPFVVISYECQTSDVHSVDMCKTNEHWSGSRMYILSDDFPSYSLHHQCGCTFSLHESLDLEISIRLFEQGKSKEEELKLKDHPCSQYITFWTEFGHEKICSEATDNPRENLRLRTGKYFHVQYANPLDLNVKYWITLKVHHDHDFNATCSANFSIPAPTTIRPSRLPTAKTTSLPKQISTIQVSDKGNLRPTEKGKGPKSEEYNGSDNNTELWQMIAGILAALLVTVLIIVGIVIFCKRRKRREREQGEKKYEQDLSNAFENTMYMHPDQVVHTGTTQGQVNTEQSPERTENRGAEAHTDQPPLPPPQRPMDEEKEGFDNLGFELPSRGDPYKEYLEKDHHQLVTEHYDRLKREALKDAKY